MYKRQYSYSFESDITENGDWSLGQSNNIESQWSFSGSGNTIWTLQSGIAVDGDNSIKVDADNMLVGVSTQLISKAYDLSAYSSPAIKFSWSGAAINTFPVNELLVTYSDDCGESWKSLDKIGAADAASAGLYTTSFEPNSSQWNDIVMANSQLKKNNIRFKFEYVVNGSSNNFYLDHIRIGEQSSLMMPAPNSNARLSVFPNPSKGNATIALENISEKLSKWAGGGLVGLLSSVVFAQAKSLPL